MYELHVQHRDHLGEIITYENGKPTRDALAEVDASTKAYEWFSEEAKRVYGDIIPSPAANKRFLVLKQAIGVCGFITPVSSQITTTNYAIIRLFQLLF